MDPATGEMVDKGAHIPMEQILCGPKRGTLEFEQSREDRSIGQMVGGADRPEGPPPEVKATGWKASKRKGWTSLRRGQVVAYQSGVGKELSVGYVLYNDTENDSVELHQCRSTWTGTSVVHLKEYRLPVSEGGLLVTEPTDEVVKCLVFYQH